MPAMLLIPCTVHHCLPEWHKLKCEASHLDKPKIWMSKDGNLGRQNDHLTFRLDKICHIMRHMLKKETK